MKKKQLCILLVIVFLVIISSGFLAINKIIDNKKIQEVNIKVDNLKISELSLCKNDNYISGMLNDFFYKTLITKDKKTGEIKKGINDKLVVSNDKLEYEIDLNKEFKWNDNDIINADDVISSFKFKRHDNFKDFDNISTIDKLSNSKVKFVLKKQDENFLDELSKQHIYPEEFSGSVNLSTKSIKTIKDTKLIGIYVNGLEIQVKNTKINFRNDNNCDYELVSASKYKNEFSQMNTYNLKPVYVNTMYYLAFNDRTSAFKENDEREGFIQKINLGELINSVYKDINIANKTNSIYFEDDPGYEFYDNKNDYVYKNAKFNNNIKVLINGEDEKSKEIINYIVSKFGNETKFEITELDSIEFQNAVIKKMDNTYDLILFRSSESNSILNFIKTNYISSIKGIDDLESVFGLKVKPEERKKISELMINENLIRPLSYEQKIVKESNKVYNNSNYEFVEDTIIKNIKNHF